MNLSVTAQAEPMYVELAPAGSMPAAGTTAALLRDYLGILAWYLDKPGSVPDAAAISTAIANLPGLVLQNTTQGSDRVAVTRAGPQADASALAGILAGMLGAASTASAMLTLSKPIARHLDAVDPDGPDGSSLPVSMIVLRRPAGGTPTLEFITLTLTLRESDPPTTTVLPPPGPVRELSAVWSVTTYTATESQLASSQQFVDQMRQEGRIADLSRTAAYLAVPFS